MNLYIARHGDAVKVGGHIHRDADRVLSAQGESDAALMGRMLARLEPHIKLVMTSPLARAEQTGRILAAAYGDHTPIHVTEHLAPGFNPKGLFADVLARRHSGSVLLVGHQPDMGMLVSYLLAGGHDVAVRMETCTVAALHVEPPHMRGTAQLHWTLTAELVKRLAQ